MERSQATKSNYTTLKYTTIITMSIVVKYYHNCRYLNYIVVTVWPFYQYNNILANITPRL